MKSLGPQWIFITGYINDLLLIRKQMVDQQMKAPVVTMIADRPIRSSSTQRAQAAKNVTSASWWHPAEQYDGKDIFGSTSNFVKLFRDKYKGDPDYGMASDGGLRRVVPDRDRARRLARPGKGPR